MKNNKKRGFTLTELLVVIAILAILATVSVVGYTSFIERANVSNDETTVSQLNKFLTALKADHTSEYYGDEVTAENVWEVTQLILKESGLNKLEAQSKQHIYFKFDEDGIGGEYVLRKEEGLTLSLAKRLFSFLTVSATDIDLSMPGMFVETDRDGNKTYYFLAETGGTDIAHAVRGFYTFDSEKFTSFSEYFAFVNGIDSKYAPLKTLLNSSVFVTPTGNYAAYASSTPEHTRVFVLDNATYVDNKIVGLTDGNTKYLGGSSYLITVEKDTTIKLPKNIQILANALNINTNGKNVTVVLGNKTWNDVVRTDGEGNEILYKDIVDASFTTNSVTLVMGGENQKITVDGTKVYALNEDSTLNETEEGLRAVFSASNAPVDSFKIKVDEVAGKVSYVGGVIYVAENYTGNITFTAYDFAGKDGAPVSSYNVTWTSNNGQYTIGETSGIAKLVENSGATGDTITITATAVAGGQTATKDIKVVRVTGAYITFNGADHALSKTESTTIDVNIPYNAFSGSEYAFTGFTYTYNYTLSEVGISAFEAPTVTYGVGAEEELFSISGDKMTINKKPGTSSFTYTVPGFKTHTFNVTFINEVSLFNDANATVVNNETVNKYTNLPNIVVGNSGSIPLSALFTRTENNDSIPENTKIQVKIEYGIIGSGKGTLVQVKEFTYSDNWGAETFEIPATVKPSENTTIRVHIGVTDGDNYFSNKVEVKFVEGFNVDDASEWASVTSTNKAMVLLSDINIATTTITVDAGSIYGNNFKVTSTLGQTSSGAAVFCINMQNGSHVENLILTGSVYTSYSTDNMYKNTWGIGSYSGTNTITNSYVFGFTGPIALKTGSLTIAGSVIEGGNFANIYIYETANATLALNDTITIQNRNGYKNGSKTIYGMGIYIDTQATCSISMSGSTHQYNFIQKNDKNVFSGTASTIVGEIFSNDTVISEAVHKYNSIDYVNMGIIHDHTKWTSGDWWRPTYHDCACSIPAYSFSGYTNTFKYISSAKELNGVGGILGFGSKDYRVWSYSNSESCGSGCNHEGSQMFPYYEYVTANYANSKGEAVPNTTTYLDAYKDSITNK